MNKRRRPQATKGKTIKKTHLPEMGEAFRELRQGSRTSPHRNLARYERNDYRAQAQNGRWE